MYTFEDWGSKTKVHTTAFPAIRTSPSSANQEREPDLPS